MENINLGASYISADVSAWSTQQRVTLLDAIDAINAQIASPNATGITAGVGQGRASQAAPLSPIPDTDIETPSVEVEETGWTEDAYVAAIVALLGTHIVQAKVIMEAIKNGDGYVGRDKVYELGGYPDSRSLKGFTRPVNRVVEDLVEAGTLPEGAEDLLAPDYDPERKSFQRARGFWVPMEVVKIALTARDAHSAQHQADTKVVGDEDSA